MSHALRSVKKKKKKRPFVLLESPILKAQTPCSINSPQFFTTEYQKPHGTYSLRRKVGNNNRDNFTGFNTV